MSAPVCRRTHDATWGVLRLLRRDDGCVFCVGDDGCAVDWRESAVTVCGVKWGFEVCRSRSAYVPLLRLSIQPRAFC